MLIVFLGIFVIFLILGAICMFLINKLWLRSRQDNLNTDIREEIDRTSLEMYLNDLKERKKNKE